ncbi:cell division protein FtsZ [Breznakiellaceae bacterium SP9]
MNNLTINRNDLDGLQESPPVIIKVIGTGGGGSNAINAMIEYGLRGVEFIVVNTDVQDLRKSKAPTKIQIGSKYTGGRGAGGQPEKGEKAATEDLELIGDVLKGANMVFLTVGLGGGTGTGSAPIIAQEAHKMGALVVGVVTKPFAFEGSQRMKIAEEGLAKLREVVDTLIVIPNQQLLTLVERRTPLKESFLKADDVLRQGVQGISDIINETGYINIDFADAETVMRGQGDALMGIGYGSGDNRAAEASSNAVDNPLLEGASLAGATRILINATGGDDFSLAELDEVVRIITANAAPNAIIISGAAVDSNLQDQLRVTVIATGFETDSTRAAKESQSIPTIVAEPPTKQKDNVFMDLDEFESARAGTTAKSSRPAPFMPQRNNLQEAERDIEKPAIMRHKEYLDKLQPEKVSSGRGY